MRKFLVSLAALGVITAGAAPATAQWAPAPHGMSYNQNNYGHARALKARVDNLQRQIAHLAQRRMISRNEYNGLIRESRLVEARLVRNARDGRGFNQREAMNTERMIARLEQKVARDVRDGRKWAYRW